MGVPALKPGIVGKTGMSEGAALAAILESGGQDRLLRPEEVAAQILSLCDADNAMNTVSAGKM